MEKIVNMENVVNMIKGEDGCKSRLGLGWKWECFVALRYNQRHTENLLLRNTERERGEKEKNGEQNRFTLEVA